MVSLSRLVNAVHQPPAPTGVLCRAPWGVVVRVRSPGIDRSGIRDCLDGAASFQRSPDGGGPGIRPGRLEPRGRPYAEGAHIRPLGSPHDGPDKLENVLCLCPNHHVLFDRLAFTVADDLALLGTGGRLRTAVGHSIDSLHLADHRQRFASCEGAGLADHAPPKQS